MVAYNFMKCFCFHIEERVKVQTIRGDRKRHARPGEAIQLYTGMRTKCCRKIIEDPICVSVWPIRIQVPDKPGPIAPLVSDREFRVELGGKVLDIAELESVAVTDGFAGVTVKCADGKYAGATVDPEAGRMVSPSVLMATFWHKVHGPGDFEGVLIRWRPA